MAVTFHKMHGLGNDFVLLDLRRQQYPVDADTARRLADRKTGIGYDQLLVLLEAPDESNLAAVEFWNADGSRAEQCGNGMRCVGLYLDMRREAPAGGFRLLAPAGSVGLECLPGNRVRVDMGEPVFEPALIPTTLEPRNGWFQLEAGGRVLDLGAASMGNPHALVVVDDITAGEIAELGPAISMHPAFPNGCNAGFAQIIDNKNVHLRVFERGAGETRACGSGACAAIAILHRAGLVGSDARVTQAGGSLILSWKGEGKPVIMMGPASHVFEGTLT